jgi:sensor histidine kinase YesM
MLSKKAYLEGNEETSDLLVSVAGLLRYNLKRLDKPVTLYEEVSVIQQYMDIQKARFTERLQFVLDIDDTCLDTKIPGLTIQPIIENAVIHAIEPKEDGGVIRLRIKDSIEMVNIEIEDDGSGMDEHKIEQILKENPIQSEGHSTGIGFSNVVKRLRLYFEYENVIQIQSKAGNGTKVILEIPKSKESDKLGESSYCG